MRNFRFFSTFASHKCIAFSFFAHTKINHCRCAFWNVSIQSNRKKWFKQAKLMHLMKTFKSQVVYMQRFFSVDAILINLHGKNRSHSLHDRFLFQFFVLFIVKCFEFDVMSYYSLYRTRQCYIQRRQPSFVYYTRNVYVIRN